MCNRHRRSRGFTIFIWLNDLEKYVTQGHRHHDGKRGTWPVWRNRSVTWQMAKWSGLRRADERHTWHWHTWSDSRHASTATSRRTGAAARGDLFGEATPAGVTLDASTKQKPTNEGDDVHTNVRCGLDDRPILTRDLRIGRLRSNRISNQIGRNESRRRKPTCTQWSCGRAYTGLWRAYM